MWRMIQHGKVASIQNSRLTIQTVSSVTGVEVYSPILTLTPHTQGQHSGGRGRGKRVSTSRAAWGTELRTQAYDPGTAQ